MRSNVNGPHPDESRILIIAIEVRGSQGLGALAPLHSPSENKDGNAKQQRLKHRSVRHDIREGA